MSKRPCQAGVNQCVSLTLSGKIAVSRRLQYLPSSLRYSERAVFISWFYLLVLLLLASGIWKGLYQMTRLQCRSAAVKIRRTVANP